MRAVVTGGSGFIGRCVVRRLRDDGHDVYVADLRRADDDTEPVDVLDYERIRSSFGGADVVYHLAGPVLEMSREDPFGSSLLQFQGTLNVLEACRVNEVPKLVLASSFYVYDGIPADEIVNEYSPISSSKMELFGSLKVMAEQLVLAYHRRFGQEYAILRFGSAYGLGEGSNLVKTFFETGLSGGTLEVWGAGERVNQYTYVEDLAAGCVSALRVRNEIVNLISPEETSTGELARMMEERFGFRSRFLVDKPEGASVPYMSSRKAIRRLGWTPTPISDALDRVMAQAQASGGDVVGTPSP